MSSHRSVRASRLIAVFGALALIVTLAPAASAHVEREGYWPIAEERVIPEVRTDGPYVVVCKEDSADRFVAMPADVRERNQRLYDECQQDGFEHIQEAIDWVNEHGDPGHRIKVLPGVYREEPNRVLEGECAEEKEDHDQVFTYEDHLECPHAVALIHILGQDADQVGEPEEADNDEDRFSEEVECRNNLCDLQIEGTGHHPLDVVIDGGYDEDGGWLKENGIRADRADGLVIYNLTVQRFGHNGIYVLETDGYRFDRTIARWNEGYAYLNFMTDNGMYIDCEGYGSGDGALYPGSQPQHEREHWSAIVENCDAHRNMLGLSGTAGNSLLVRNNRFFDNATGWQTDSFVPNHPGMPTGWSSWTGNEVFRNNTNYYLDVIEGVCDAPPEEWGKEHGTVCPLFPAPVGTGVLLPGGNHMFYSDNDVYDNWRNGFMQFWVPGVIREDEDPEAQFDTSHFNQYRENRLGYGWRDDLGADEFDLRPNGLDFWWDDQGEGNCWQDNDAAIGEVTDNTLYPGGLPTCDEGGSEEIPANLVKSSQIASCATYDREDNPNPPGCDWQDSPDVPDDREVTVTSDRLWGEGRITTAIDVSRTIWPDGSDAVVIARADDFPDALAGGPLAAMMDAPILLTPSDSLDDDVAAEISRLDPERAYVLGGADALSSTVESALEGLVSDQVFRVAGDDRYETAVEIARLVGGPIAYLANARTHDAATGWADAISASASGAVQRRPVLLTATGQLPGVTAEALVDLGITDATIVGGEAAVSEDVFSTVAETVERADRLGGEDRYETARLLAERSRAVYANDTDLWLGTGENWPDSLVAGPAVAATRGVLLLVHQDDVPEATDDWAESRLGLVERIRTLGGEDAISDAVPDAVRDRVDPNADEPTDGGNDAGNDDNGGLLPLP